MEDNQGQEGQEQQQQQQQQQQKQPSERTEPVRSRWTPKPEQILILESIFNSGMVNPPKDETVRIRKLLEKFGAVGDANVFYWFQNRRSRSRRRQRQIQATLNNGGGASTNNPFQHHHQNNPALVANMGFASATSSFLNPSYIPPGSSSSSSSPPCGAEESFDDFFPPSTQMGFPGIDHHASAASSSSVLYPLEASNLNYHSGFGGISGVITVFINGVPTEVPRGPMDMKTAFGEDVMLVHSSGISVPTNEFGFLMQGLQHGESYFVVSKQTQV
ncbi:WUSCHEL-related homeobox 11-like isoform X2 [Vigna unguiculata]|uniref:WUSCHEL-related homeobox 11-like isoform X2 n=1 Tax=Vigna unguiculata TaxID=3917 RepID=UPI00101608E1|nr:WUSCHEL-related homeobox 11-like isoform X2 [Vigna unguiculata]